jgi:hypothetical protein
LEWRPARISFGRRQSSGVANLAPQILRGIFMGLSRKVSLIAGVIAVVVALVGFALMRAQAGPDQAPKCGGCQGVVSSTVGF